MKIIYFYPNWRFFNSVGTAAGGVFHRGFLVFCIFVSLFFANIGKNTCVILKKVSGAFRNSYKFIKIKYSFAGCHRFANFFSRIFISIRENPISTYMAPTITHVHEITSRKLGFSVKEKHIKKDRNGYRNKNAHC
jgi:hypothetical protein